MPQEKHVGLYLQITTRYDLSVARGVIRYWEEHGGWQLTPAPRLDVSGRTHYDGLIAGLRTPAEARAVRHCRIPVVEVVGAVQVRAHVVSNDEEAIGALACQHFRERGFRRFAFCGSDGVGWSDGRLRGYRAAAGGEVAVWQRPLAWWFDPGTPRSLAQWLKALQPPVGILAANDFVGTKVLAACEFAGLVVPHQYAVVGVDNDDVLCRLSRPALSSVESEPERIGYTAAQVLDRLMQHKTPGRTPVLIPPRQVVVRASSDALANGDETVATALRLIHSADDLSLNVADIVRQMSLSRRALEARFRRSLGHTLHDEIRKVRLSKACRLLVGTSLPVAKIAVLAGFSSAQSFHKVFSAHLNGTPLDYRRQHQA